MRRGEWLARQLGRAAAEGTMVHSLAAEVRGELLSKKPVALEPRFAPFDPYQTFVPSGQDVALAAEEVAWESVELLPVLPEKPDIAGTVGLLARLAGARVPSSFESVIANGKMSFRVAAPVKSLAGIVRLWSAAYPGFAFRESPDPTLSPAGVVDFYSRRPYHRAVRFPVSFWPQLVGIARDFAGETLRWEVLFAPAVSPWTTNVPAILASEKNLGVRAPFGQTVHPKPVDEPVFAVSVRCWCSSPEAEERLQSIASLFTADGVALGVRTAPDYLKVLSPKAFASLVSRRVVFSPGMLLASSELAGFLHLPEVKSTAGLQVASRQGLLVPQSLQVGNFCLGVNWSSGVPVPVYRPRDEYNRCAWVLGTSGRGKSSGLTHWMLDLVRSGVCVIFLDPHRTSALDLAGCVGDLDPEQAVLLDFDDPTGPVAFNPFAARSGEDLGRLAGQFVHTFKVLFDADLKKTNYVLGNAIYGLLVLGENLVKLPELFAKSPAGDALRERMLPLLANDSVRRFWLEEFPKMRGDALGPVISRFGSLFLDSLVRRTFSQVEHKVDLSHCMDSGKLVLVALPQNPDAANLLGGLLVEQVRHLGFRRAGTPSAKHHVHLVIDEAHRFTNARTVQSILDEGAKSGVSICVVNQEISQVPTDVVSALHGAPNLFVFGVNPLDAKHLAPLFGSGVTPDVLAGQERGSVYARMQRDVVSFVCPPPLRPDPAVFARVLADSRSKYYGSAVPSALPSPSATVRRRRNISSL